MIVAKNKLVETKNQDKHLSGGFVIPHEVVDGIVLASLQEQYEYIKKDLHNHLGNPTKHYLHEDDVTMYHELVYCLNKLIGYYGGEHA